MTIDPRDQFKQGHLTPSIEGMTQEVKRNPTDAQRRTFLAELLCFSCEFERADRLLDVVASQDAGRAIEISQFRQVLRAEVVRHQVFEDGRAPEFLGPPPPHVEDALRALAALRAGDAATAAALVASAEHRRPPAPCICNGQPFDDFRDADDLTAGLLEVLTMTGQYYWVPLREIGSVTFQPPRRPRDMIWRRARLTMRNGPDGDVVVPALYPLWPADANDTLRLGQATDWTAGAPVRGIGQRVFLAGELDIAVTALNILRFESASAGS